jgi:hypothetical protein
VSPDFFSGASYNLSLVQDVLFSTTTVGFSGPQSNQTFFPVLQNLSTAAAEGSLHNLSFSECRTGYGSQIQNRFRNVFLVVNETLTTNPLIGYSYYSPGSKEPGSWYCARDMSNPALNYTGSTQEVVENPGNLTLWTLPPWSETEIAQFPSRIAVAYCLAEEFSSSQCSLRFNFGLMAFVIVSNILKLIVMAILLWRYNQPTFVTIGDAIASYLEHPDPTTRGYALGTIQFHRPSRGSTKRTRPRSQIPKDRASNIRNTGRPAVGKRLRKTMLEPWLQNPEDGRYHSRLWPSRWFSAVSSFTWLWSLM